MIFAGSLLSRFTSALETAEIPAVIIPSTAAFNLNRILKEIVSNIIHRAKEIGASVSWHSEQHT
ncbi:MAG: hypothetical protein Q7V56_13765 [Gammaproteobacteria bacterium]|nr:hypothetical protein [Gammaproteobacteria bacterium]